MKRAIVIACIGVVFLFAVTVEMRAAPADGVSVVKKTPSSGSNPGLRPPSNDLHQAKKPVPPGRKAPGTTNPGDVVPPDNGVALSDDGIDEPLPPPAPPGDPHRLVCGTALAPQSGSKAPRGGQGSEDDGLDLPDNRWQPYGQDFIQASLSSDFTPGPQPGNRFELDLSCPGEHGQWYILMASYGTSPGISLGPLDPRRIPLNADDLYYMSIDLQNADIFQKFFGCFDSQNRAQAYFMIPDDPQLIGITIYFCYIILDPSWLSGVKRISNVLPITIM